MSISCYRAKSLICVSVFKEQEVGTWFLIAKLAADWRTLMPLETQPSEPRK